MSTGAGNTAADDFVIEVTENAQGNFTWKLHRERPYCGVFEMRGCRTTKEAAKKEARVWRRRLLMADQ